MPWTDDRLEALLRDSDPAHTPRDAVPSPADWARLQRIITAEPAQGPRQFGRRIHTLWAATQASRPLRVALRSAWAIPALAAILAIGLTIGPLTATRAYAMTPPPLTAQPVGQSTNAVLDSAIATLQTVPAHAATHDARLVRWTLRDDQSKDPVIVPEWQKWVWDADGVGHLEAMTGAPYSVTTDGKIVAPAGDAPKAGTPVKSQRPQRVTHFRAAPPENSEALRSYLQQRANLHPDADGLTLWGAISAIRDEWSLSPAQQAAALQVLREAGGVSVLGTVTDRFGRAGIAMKITSTKRPQFAATVVLDADTHEFLAADILYLGGSSMKLDVPPGSVIEYKAWLSR